MKFKDVQTSTCVPFNIEKEDSRYGSVIGGKSPIDVKPYFPTSFQKYFSTVYFEDKNLGVSIFYSFDIYGDSEDRDIISFNNRILFPSELLHAVIHKGSRRDMNSNVISEVSSHKITFYERIDDNYNPYPRSKLGGVSFIDNEALVGAAFDEIHKMGYRQLIQFDTPNPANECHVKGFPWDPGWLHVFVKGTQLTESTFAFIIQQ